MVPCWHEWDGSSFWVIPREVRGPATGEDSRCAISVDESEGLRKSSRMHRPLVEDRTSAAKGAYRRAHEHRYRARMGLSTGANLDKLRGCTGGQREVRHAGCTGQHDTNDEHCGSQGLDVLDIARSVKHHSPNPTARAAPRHSRGAAP